MTNRADTIAALRARLSVMDRIRAPAGQEALSLGLAALDGALAGGGLVRGGLHEFLGEAADAAPHGFVASLLARLPAAAGPVLWCRLPPPDAPADTPYAPGLVCLGADPDRLILARPRSLEDALWVLEEALRCPRLGAVVGDGITPPPVAGRRLQLAAEEGGMLGLLILPPQGRPLPSTALTRWRVRSLPDRPGEGDWGRPCWQVDLLRARGGGLTGTAADSGTWKVVWDDAAFRLHLVEPLADGPVAAAE
jgi:protein ImuA